MFTDCPECHRQFRVRAQQLSVAKGLVQCGFCGEQFNALDRLYDSPQNPPQVTDVPVLSVEEIPVSEPDFDISADQPERVSDSIGTDADIDDSEDDKPDYQNIEELNQDKPDLDSWMPPVLQEDAPVKTGWLSRLAWITGVLILFTVAVGQVAWFNRDELLSRYPQASPWVQRVCEYFQCKILRQRNVSAIKLVNRDVREHPRFENALLVNATIQNTAKQTQPYPRVQLVLFDTNGELIAYREFAPREYLDESIEIEQGMRFGQPVHIVLEVTDSSVISSD